MKYEKHVKSALGNFAYEKITADKLNDFIQGKLSSGLSAKYTADIAGVIKSVCRFAKKRFGYDDKSEFITMPKGKAKEKGCCLTRKIQKIDKQNTKSKPPKLRKSAAYLFMEWLCKAKF